MILFHPGMNKCASTYFQAWVENVPDVNLVRHHECTAVVQGVLDGVLKGRGPVIDFSGFQRDTIITSESFQGSIMGYDRATVEAFHAAVADSLAKAPQPAVCLIIVREPAAWMKSIYGQSVKMGESRSILPYSRRLGFAEAYNPEVAPVV